MPDTPVSIWMRPERASRGPRPAYSRAQITRAAIAIADREGLDAASNRRIAAEIGAGMMSLYRYVSSRDELVELMVDTVYGEFDLPAEPSEDWRADLRLVARQLRRLGRRHPWVATLTPSRPALGPNTLRLVEFGCGTLDARGIPIDETVVLFRLLEGYVWNVVREEIGLAEAQRRGAQAGHHRAADDAYVRHLVDSGEYPTFTRIVRDARGPHLDAASRFEYGLDRVLTGIAASLPSEPVP